MTANITAEMVKNLREKTGAGMMECKKALVESQGDFETAEKLIAKSGLNKAAKSESRTAAEGCVVFKITDDSHRVVLIEINSETDFVAKDLSFVSFCEGVCETALTNRTTSLDSLLAAEFSGDTEKLKLSGSVEEVRKTLIARIGENIQIRRIEYIEAQDGFLGAYRHGVRIGVIVQIKGGDSTLARDLAMHIAAVKPHYIRSEEVPATEIEKQKALFLESAKASGKPAEILEKIVEGQLTRYLNEICLVGQPFVKNPDQTIGVLLKEKNATVERFTRFEVGEGIEVKKARFDEEVRAQIKGT